jgi:hypothetical protein
MQSLLHPPPWLDLLNALQLEWRESELLLGRDPDIYLEQLLRETEKWPPPGKSAYYHQAPPRR